MLTAKQAELREVLYSIFDDQDYVMAIGCRLKTDDEVREMLDFIDLGDWQEPYELTIKALQIEHDNKTGASS